MLICSCNLITNTQIEEVIDAFLREDPWMLITPARVYQAMEKRGQCCGCFPNVVSLISARVQAHHAGLHTPQTTLLPLLRKLQTLAAKETTVQDVALG